MISEISNNGLIGSSVFYLFQVTVLTTLLLLVSSKIKHNKPKAIFSIVAAMFLSIEILAIYLTEGFIDYRFYTHMNFNAIQGQGFQFATEIILFALLFITLSFLFYKKSKRLHHSIIRRNKVFFPIVLVLFIALSTPHGPLNEIYKVLEIVNTKERNFEKALNDVGILSSNYITPNQVTATKGKNIIIISIESLEQGFLGENYGNITPYLSALTKNWTYYDQMLPAPGGGWTAGSLYSHQVGIPGFFKGQGNDIFQGISEVKLTGLGHILGEAGYDSAYIIGNPEFAGMSDIISAYGIPVISEKNSIGDYPPVKWGFGDYDLFNEAKLQLEKYKTNNGKPFALFLSTINTHFPGGIYDHRMEKFIPKRKNAIEFSAAAVDYLINDFISYLKKSNLYENTAIFIFPDHLMMGSGSSVHKKLNKLPRKLYLLTNIEEEKFTKKTTDEIYQIDLPRLIINGSGIKTNANFLTDFIKNKNIPNYLKNNKSNFSALNQASVTKTTYQAGIDIKMDGSNLLVESGLENIVLPLDGKKIIQSFDITFNEEMVPIERSKTNLNYAFSFMKHDKKHKRLHLIIKTKSKKIDSTYLGNKKMIGISKYGDEVQYSTNDIRLIMESNSTGFLPEKKQKESRSVFRNDQSLVSITSSEFGTSKNIRSVIKTNKNTYKLSRGLNLLSINSEGEYEFENFDTWLSKDAADDFIVRLKDLIQNNKFWALAANDAIKNSHPGYKAKLGELNFKLLPKLNGAVAFIAYSDSANRIHEHTSKTTLSYTIPSFMEPLSEELIKSIKQSEYDKNIISITYGKNTERFIAHAGGGIDGRKYTDSLDALNLNYKKGFRLFELDINKTSDGVYAAVHDWKHWAKITGYKGDLPPTNRVFLRQKIYKKYSPVDIDVMNKWFGDHPDAILVTDKVDTPIDFAEKFIDKKRLMMELFSWNSVKKGIETGIRSAMPTGSIIQEVEGDKVSYLKTLGVTNIAVNRRVIYSDKKLWKKIVQSGIKVYAFNLDKDNTEIYVACNESDYFYGMYADIWDFDTPLICLK